MSKPLITPKLFLFIVITLVGTGGILYGFDVGVISGALLILKHTMHLTPFQSEIIVGAVFGGSLLGTLVAGPMADSLGRRCALFFSSVIFIAGIFCVIFSHGFLLLFSGRLLLGIGIGIVSVAVPLYALELAPTKVRGQCVTVFQLFLTFGILVAYFVDMLFVHTGNWRGMFEVVLIPAVVLLLGIIVLPESPRWLLMRHRKEKAQSVLTRLRGASEVEFELAKIKQSFNQSEGAWRDLFKRSLIFPIFLAVSIAFLQQLTGINVILQYAPVMLKHAGFSSDHVTMLGSVGIGLLNLIFTVLALLLVDRIGRRPLLLTGLVGIVIAEVALGFFQFTHMGAMFSLGGLFLFIMSFAIGPGVVIWLVMSELFPTTVRGKGLALCLFFNSLASTLASSVFLTLMHGIGLGGVYWMAAGFTFVYLLIAFIYLPETRARSLEDIQDDMSEMHEAKKAALADAKLV